MTDKVVKFNLAGVTFDGRQGILKKLALINGPRNIDITFTHEFDNKFDSNAILAEVVINGEEFAVGYIPKTLAKSFATVITSSLKNNDAYHAMNRDDKLNYVKTHFTDLTGYGIAAAHVVGGGYAGMSYGLEIILVKM